MADASAHGDDERARGDVIRRLAPGDSFAALTELLHRAYAPLSAAGLNFTAVDQDEARTRERCGRGATFVAERDGRLVGTLTVVGPAESKEYGRFATPTSWHLEQFAVEPALQGTGVGRALVVAAERFARDHGATAILGDTSEQATHLVALYARAGYGVVGQIQWPGKTYRSVVMEKRIDRATRVPELPSTDSLRPAEFGFPGPGRDRLVAAVLAGTKTAGTGLLEEHHRLSEPLPEAGDRGLVLDSAGRGVAVIETTAVEVKRLDDVDLAFVVDEGEGYATVAAWRDAHVRFFSSPAMAAVLGEPPVQIDGNTLVVCERFRVVQRL
jgi:uncharacterized protein YhfF/GNAT superfamily N-acetyltransferase